MQYSSRHGVLLCKVNFPFCHYRATVADRSCAGIKIKINFLCVESSLEDMIHAAQGTILFIRGFPATARGLGNKLKVRGEKNEAGNCFYTEKVLLILEVPNTTLGLISLRLTLCWCTRWR